MSSEKPEIPNSLNEHWMPFSSNRDFKANPRLITEAKGVYLKNHQGQTQLMPVLDYSAILWAMEEKKLLML